MQIQKKPQSHKRNRTEKRFLKTINQQELLVQLSDTNIGSDSKETSQGEEGGGGETKREEGFVIPCTRTNEKDLLRCD